MHASRSDPPRPSPSHSITTQKQPAPRARKKRGRKANPTHLALITRLSFSVHFLFLLLMVVVFRYLLGRVRLIVTTFRFRLGVCFSQSKSRFLLLFLPPHFSVCPSLPLLSLAQGVVVATASPDCDGGGKASKRSYSRPLLPLPHHFISPHSSEPPYADTLVRTHKHAPACDSSTIPRHPLQGITVQYYSNLRKE